MFQSRLERADAVDIIADDVSFVRHLIVTLIACRIRGARIRIAFFPQSIEDSDPRILHLLTGLNCSVGPLLPIPTPLVAAFFDPTSKSDASMLIPLRGLEQQLYDGKFKHFAPRLDGDRRHGPAYKSLLPNHSADEFAPTLDGATRFDRDEIILRLKSRHIYREGEFEYRTVSPEEIYPQKQLIRRFKRNQVRLLRSMYSGQSCPL